jgi:hypothetical protein
MNLNLGLYDIFSNIVPGFIYLLVLYEFSKITKFQMPLHQMPEGLSLAVVLTLTAYILGHLLNTISYHYWYRRFESYSTTRRRVMEGLKRDFPELKIGFNPDDAEMLLAIIQHNNFNISETFERLRANGIMMRNLSLGFMMLSITTAISLLQNWFQYQYLVYIIGWMCCSGLSLRKAKDFTRWFFRDIFREALNYGSNLSEVLKKSRVLTEGKKPK